MKRERKYRIVKKCLRNGKIFSRIVEFEKFNASLDLWEGDTYNLLSVDDFIGIKDKNGVDIFEGDKCLIKASEPLFTEQFSTDYDWAITAEVRYDLDYCGFIFKDFAICSISELNSVDAEIEVIGNIYKNT